MTYKTQGIILKYTDLGENSRLLAIYTKDFGRIQVQARAVKKTTSKLAGHLELLTLSRLVLARGRFLDIVIDAFTVNSFKGVRASLRCRAAAFCVVELVDNLTGEGQADKRIFNLLIKALEFLDQRETLERESFDVFRLLMVRFGLRLLVLLGFAPEEESNQVRAIRELPLLERKFKYYLGFTPAEEIKSLEFLKEISLLS